MTDLALFEGDDSELKEIYGAPATKVPLSPVEDRVIRRERAPFSAELMTKLLTDLTPDELAMKEGRASADYDYNAFSFEESVFEPGNIVHILRHLKYDRHELHSHRFFEIICQVAGEGRAVISGEQLRLVPGKICVLSPGVVHRVEVFSDDAILLKIILRKTDFDSIFRQLLRSDTLLASFFSSALYDENCGWLSFDADDPEITGMLLRMRYHEVREAPTDPMMKEALLTQLLCTLVDRHAGTVNTSSGLSRRGKLIARIRAEYRTVKLDELAEEFHLTQSYLSRVIRQETGQSFTELIENLRLDHAARLLATTKMPVEQIAVEAGFGCREFFHRKFKERYGVPPSVWRKNGV